MKNFLAAFWVALMCLVGAVAHATAPTGVPLFVELARDNPQELQAAMTAAGAFKPDRGEVYVPIVGMAMHQTLKAAGVLREEMVNIPPGRNPTIEAAVREHGQILSWPVFLERAQAGRFIAPRQVLREEVWQAYSAKLAQTAPVQAASAPTTQPAAAAPAPQPATPVAVAPAPPAVDAAAMQALEAEVAAARRDAATARDVATAQGQAHATINSRVRAAEARAAALAKQLAEMQVAARAQTAAQERALAKLLEEQGAALKAATDLSRKTQEAVAGVPALASAAAGTVFDERIAPLKKLFWQAVLVGVATLILTLILWVVVWRGRRKVAVKLASVEASSSEQKDQLQAQGARLASVEAAVHPIVLPDDFDQLVDGLGPHEEVAVHLSDKRDGKRYVVTVVASDQPGYYFLRGVKDLGRNKVHRHTLRRVLQQAGEIQLATGRHRLLEEVKEWPVLVQPLAA